MNETDVLLAARRVRCCPLGPPRKIQGRVCYAWCSECERVRKSTHECPMTEAQQA